MRVEVNCDPILGEGWEGSFLGEGWEKKKEGRAALQAESKVN